MRLNDAAIERLAESLLQRVVADRRYLLGIAGIPGSGKSTLASKLLAALEARRPGVAALVPMDGFHYCNDDLQRMALRDRKGAPQTFDARAYCDLLRQARDPARTLYFPVYDRDLHEPVLRQAPGQCIDANVRVVLTEGNYLLLDEEPWRQLATLLDACWLLQTDPGRAREWIIARHMRGGRARQDAQAHYDRSDRRNVELLQQRSRPADLVLAWEQET